MRMVMYLNKKDRLLRVKNKYDKLAKVYDDIFTYKINQAEDEIVGSILRKLQGRYLFQNVLDLGCGTGFTLKYITLIRYFGIDISPQMIKIAKKKYPQHTFKVQDMNHIQNLKHNFFELVVSLFNSFSYTSKPR